MTYPPADDRLRHLFAQRINCHVDSWKLAFFIAGAMVDDPEIRAELGRVETTHAAGRPCGDRNCPACFSAATAAPAAVSPPVDRAAFRDRIAEAECPQCGDTGACNGGPCALASTLPASIEDHRLALCDALRLGSDATWEAILDRATELGLPPIDQDPVARRLGLLPASADRAAVLTEAAEPFPIWTVWREDQPAYGYFATEDIAKRASIDCWEEDEPACPDYSWRPDGGPGNWELLVGDERAEVHIRRHLVWGGLPQPPRAAVLTEAADAVFALDYDVMVGEVGDENLGSMREAWDLGTIHAEKLLRRLAGEAAPDTSTEADATLLAELQQHLANHTPSCNARVDHLMRRAAWALGAPRPAHVGGNAEDCQACEGTNPPYPFICPGPEVAAETVHAYPPDGSGLTPCCGRTPFELPRTDRTSSEAPVTCQGPEASHG